MLYTTYELNWVSIKSILNKTAYELRKDKKTNISYFHVFAWEHYILKNKKNLGRFDSKSDKAIFSSYFERTNLPQK